MRRLVGNPAWLDGLEHASTVLIRGQASKAVERGINRLLLIVIRMVVFSGGIGLPHLDHCIIHGSAVTIVHAASEAYALALTFRGREPADRVVLGAAQVKERACGLRGRGNEFVRFQRVSPPVRAGQY